MCNTRPTFLYADDKLSIENCEKQKSKENIQWPEAISSTITKVEMAKDIFEMCIVFDIWCQKHFAIRIRQIQSKLLHEQVCKLVLIEFALSK